jgi:hypothetical protein
MVKAGLHDLHTLDCLGCGGLMADPRCSSTASTASYSPGQLHNRVNKFAAETLNRVETVDELVE